MALTSRKKRPLDRNIEHLRDTRLIIIATEGEKTEKQYFGMFHNIKVQVQVIPTEEGLSAPEYVLERLNQFSDQYQLGDEDELWLMIDVDRWGESKLSHISAATAQKGYKLAVSNPCFELWLYLHFFEPSRGSFTCDEVINLLRQHIGSYNKINLNIEVYRPYVTDAVTRAERLHVNASERWPSSVGSHVYKVVKKIV
jgi:hypothetical protein